MSQAKDRTHTHTHTDTMQHNIATATRPLLTFTMTAFPHMMSNLSYIIGTNKSIILFKVKVLLSLTQVSLQQRNASTFYPK